MEQRYTQGIRVAAIIASLLLLVVLLIGLTWDWVTALAFIIGGAFFALCCFLSYHHRISFSFNNIPDTNMSSTVAFFTHSIPKSAMPPRPELELETFKPFTFKQDKEKEVEEMRVRALLRQVFPDEEAV
ncbi:MAG: hypothetical protein NVS4B11_25040 [Ktedonobacteraceae bacterium]